MTLIEGKGILLAPVLFVLFMFFIPISPTLKSIFFGCSIVAILLTPYYNKHIFYAFSTVWGCAAVCMFVYILIACLWSPAPFMQQFLVVGKYCKLIYLPILAAGFIDPKTRKWSINSYLAAMFFTSIISILKYTGIFLMSDDPGEIFYNHIITGFMMAFAAYLSALFVFHYSGWKRLVYLLLTLFMSYQVLFINTGRTGYIVYFILMALLLVQKLTFKKALLSLFLFSAICFLAYHESPTMQNRISDLVTDIHALKQNNQNTSLGYRIQFHDYAHSLWDMHPIIGIGTGGFKYSFSLDDPVPSWGKELTDPHSQYWMTLAEHGIIGLALLGILLGSLFITALQLTETRPVLLGILISFCIGSLSDTILCYSTVGYLLVVMSALCFGELIEKHASRLVLATNKKDDRTEPTPQAAEAS